MASVIRLLYVDDEPSLLDIGKIFLEESGNFSVETIESATAALELIKREPFDAIVSDFQMPGMDGIRFLIEVRAQFGQIPFILFTGRGREEIVIQAINSGADFYLQKGGDPGAQFAELSHKVRAAVAQRTNELAFKESEERFRGITERISDLIIIVDTEGCAVFVSPSITTILGFPQDMYVGKKAGSKFIPAEDAAKIGLALDRVKNASPAEQLEFRMEKSDGSYAVFEGTGTPVFKNGIYSGVQVVARDITGRKRADEALRESEEKYRLVVENSHDAVYIYRGDRFVFINRMVSEMSGFDHDELMQKKYIWDLVHPDDRAQLQSYARQRAAGLEAPPIYSARILTKSGDTRWAEFTVARIIIRGEMAVLGMVRDITEQKKVKDAFLESSRKYTELFELGSEAVFLIDNETGAIIEANAAASEMYGYSRDTLLTMKNTDLSAEPEDTQKFTTATPHGTIRIPIRHHRRNDGTVFPVEILGRFFTWNERPVHIAAIRDITERRQAEEAMRESHDRFEQISKQSREMVWEVDTEGLYTFVSPACHEIIGFSPEELVKKKHFYDLHPEEGREIFKTATLEAFAKRTVFSDFLNLRQTKDGRIVWMSTNGMPFFDEYNNFLGYRGSDGDITGRKQADEIRTRFGRILESSLNEIYFFDAETLRFVDVNHGARENIGYTMDELHSMTPLDIITEYTKESFESLLAPLRSGEKEIQVVFTVHIRKDGSPYPVEVHLQLAGNEELPVFVAIILDITERRQIEEALRLANWKLNLLSGITRHDINNQMTVLLGYLSLLEMNPSDPSLTDYLKKMDASAKRISSMIQFTKEYDEIGITVPAWQNVRTLVTNAALEVSFGNIQLNNDLPAGTEVFAEPLIFKVFYNLMDNAIRYGDTITTIRFFIENRSGDQIIVCEDDGVGVPAEEKEKIFLRGFGKNTGLGLALTQEILEITGISIEETGEPGKGARFEMTVPKGMWRMAGKGA